MKRGKFLSFVAVATPSLLRSSGEFPHVGSLLNFPADKESSFIRKPSPL